MAISTLKSKSLLSKDQWVARFNKVYATVGDYFLKSQGYPKVYWPWEAANVMEGLVAMLRATGDLYYAEELENMSNYILDNEQGYFVGDSNFTANVFCPIVKFARLVTDKKYYEFYAIRDKIVTFINNVVIPVVKTWIKEFQLDGKTMNCVWDNGPIPFNQQDQTFVWLLHLSFMTDAVPNILERNLYRDYFKKYAEFVKWARVFTPCCFDTSKQTYKLAYRRYTGLPGDLTGGFWCSTPDCDMVMNYSNYHVDIVMEGVFNNLGFTKQDAEYIANGFVYGMWDQNQSYPLLSLELGGCGQNIIQYDDFHKAYLTGQLINFIRLAIINPKVMEISEKIVDNVYRVGEAQNKWWTTVYHCVPMTNGGQSCYADIQEQPDWMLREIGNILTTMEGFPPGPGPEINDGQVNSLATPLAIIAGGVIITWVLMKKSKKK